MGLKGLGPFCFGCNVEYQLVRLMVEEKPAPNMVSIKESFSNNFEDSRWICQDCVRKANAVFSKLSRAARKEPEKEA